MIAGNKKINISETLKVNSNENKNYFKNGENHTFCYAYFTTILKTEETN